MTVILSIDPRRSASLTRSFDIFLLTLSKGSALLVLLISLPAVLDLAFCTLFRQKLTVLHF
jgi:hypothetical protein